jgi:cyanophycinase
MNRGIGKLIALGGGYDDDLLTLIKEEVCDRNARIEVISTASSEPEEVGIAYLKAFGEIGCGNGRYMHIDEGHPADLLDFQQRMREAEVVFFTGGDQLRLREFLLGTSLLAIMRERYLHDGLVIAGTSAGAAVMTDRMIFRGYGYRALLKGETDTTEGFSFIQNLYIDSHFSERGRFGRLAHAVLKRPEFIGIGLGEETGIIIKNGNEVEVFGTGVVTVMDGSEIRHSNIASIPVGSPIAIERLVVHLLVEGHRYCLREREYQQPGGKRA